MVPAGGDADVHCGGCRSGDLWRFGPAERPKDWYGRHGNGRALLLFLSLRTPPEQWQDVVIYATSMRQAITLIPYYLLGTVYALAVPQRFLNLPAAVCFWLVAECFMSRNLLYEFVRMAVLSYLIFSLALATPVLKLPKWAEMSYGIYLYGFPVQQTVIYFSQKWSGALDHPNRLLLLSIPFVVPLALLSEFLVERPMGVLSKKICAKLSS